LAAWNGISVSLRNEASELRHNSASSLKEQPLDRRNTKARFSTKMSSSIQNRWRLTGKPEVIHLDVKPAARTFVTEQGEPTIDDQVDEMPTIRQLAFDFHLSMSDSAIMHSSRSSRARSGHWRLLFRNHNQEVEDLTAALRAHGISDDEFVAPTMGEEFSLPCPLAALF
jgi:hypothetical protein